MLLHRLKQAISQWSGKGSTGSTWEGRYEVELRYPPPYDGERFYIGMVKKLTRTLGEELPGQRTGYTFGVGSVEEGLIRGTGRGGLWEAVWRAMGDPEGDLAVRLKARGPFFSGTLRMAKDGAWRTLGDAKTEGKTG